MKIWNKAKNWDFGETIVSWRKQDWGKFFSKIFSWLLGAFVFGILASIFFIAINQPDYAQPTARIVFFVIFIIGVTSSFFRAVYFGFKYAITAKALIHSHPFFGWEPFGALLGSESKPFRQIYYFIEWQDVKEIREHPKGLEIELKNEDTLEIPVTNVRKLTLNLNLKKPELKEKGATKSEKLAYDKAVQKIVLQAARDARKSALNANQ